MAQPGGKQELCSDIFKATQDIAAQAALRAQERLQKVREPPPPDVPEIPARSSGVFQKAPDIPPKKFANNNVPPPLPQKPQPRTDHLSNNGVYAQTAAPPEMPKRLDYLPQVPTRNPVDKGSGMQMPMKNGNSNGQLELKQNKPMHNNKLNQLSPTEDTSSEDALRGIESGLRNMERAMQEQLSMRSMEATDGSKFNVSEFRAGLRNIGSLSSFEGLQPPQYMINNNPSSTASNGTGRPVGLERGMSMDQMRLDSQLRNMDSNPNLRSAAEEIKIKPQDINGGGGGKGRPLEQHMRSLDRNLPLELQYSRNHHRQQQLQQQQLLLQQQLVSKVMNAPDPNRHMDMLNQFMNRPPPSAMGPINAANVGPVPNIIGRDDIKLRRRSSHDENQILQTTNTPSATSSGPGTLNFCSLNLYLIYKVV